MPLPSSEPKPVAAPPTYKIGDRVSPAYADSDPKLHGVVTAIFCTVRQPEWRYAVECPLSHIRYVLPEHELHPISTSPLTADYNSDQRPWLDIDGHEWKSR